MRIAFGIGAWFVASVVFTIVVSLPLSVVVDLEGAAGLVLGIFGIVVCIPIAWIVSIYAVERRWIR